MGGAPEARAGAQGKEEARLSPGRSRVGAKERKAEGAKDIKSTLKARKAEGTEEIRTKGKAPKAESAEEPRAMARAKARKAESAEETRTGAGAIVQQAVSAGKTRSAAKVEELPAEAREAIDRMLSEGGCGYEQIAGALAEAGFCIRKGAVGRYEARKADDARQVKLMIRQFELINRWMEKHPGFDMSGAALSLVISRLIGRLQNDETLFDKLPAEKAATELIQAARAVAQHEKIADGRKKQKATARAEVIRELREAMKREPELWERIEVLAARDS